MIGPALSDRTRRILATLVRSYIETGEPVASATLAHKAGLNLSSATVRNVLAQLEEMGFVWQPHTSAAASRPTRGIAVTSTCCSTRAAPRKTRQLSKRACGRKRAMRR
jgi:hypothetical protein